MSLALFARRNSLRSRETRAKKDKEKTKNKKINSTVI